MPSATDDFSAGLFQVFRDGVSHILPDVREASKVCLGLLAAVLLTGIVGSIHGSSASTTDLVGTAAISMLLLQSTGSMINLAVNTVTEIGEYGKLLLPVMTTAMAAQGAITASAAICSGTMLFSTILTNLVMKALIPMTYIYLALSIASGVVAQDMLKKIRDLIKWIQTWVLKTILYVFTGFIGITGVVSGTTDATAMKVAKVTISNAVPVVGGIISDASEAVLTGAQTVKNAAGIYGMFAIIAVWIHPFLKIGVQYLMLKGTAALSQVIGSKKGTDVIADFSSTMGFLLGMTGSVTLMMIISTTCFLKGTG